MPLSLNEPLGCKASIFNQTFEPEILDSGVDSSSGVLICREFIPMWWSQELNESRRLVRSTLEVKSRLSGVIATCFSTAIA